MQASSARVQPLHFSLPVRRHGLVSRMPSTSKSQRRLMGMALAYKRGALPDAPAHIRELAESMTEEQLGHYARTPEDDLPEKRAALRPVAAVPAVEAAESGPGAGTIQVVPPPPKYTGPLTGPEALHHALKSLDLKKLEQEQMDIIRTRKVSKRPRAVDVLNVLEGMRRNEMTPDDFFIRSVPVIPAAFRPYSSVGSVFIPGDANELYGDLFKFRDTYRQVQDELGDDAAKEVKADMYRAAKALYGYGDPVSAKLKQRGVSGFMHSIIGSNPKFSFVQRKLLSKPQDSVARGTIIPDPELSMNEIGVPRDMAWTMYGPYVQRRMVQAGFPMSQALQHLKDRTPHAEKMLVKEMESRPVVYTRAPAWHKFNVLAGRPKLIDGHVIKISPLVATGANADYDGDDYIDKILVLVPRQHKSLYSAFGFDVADLDSNAVSMKHIATSIPAYDTDNFELCLYDLEDFPHGDLLSTKEGQNGHIAFYRALPGFKVIAYDESTGGPVWADLFGYSVHKERQVELVHLSNGSVSITDDDPRAVYGVPHDACELQRDTPTNAQRRKFVIPFSSRLEQAVQDVPKDTKVQFPGFPGGKLPLDFDMGYWLGAMAGDGWCAKKAYDNVSNRFNWQWHLSDKHGHNAAAVQKILDPWIGHASTWTSKRFDKADTENRYGDTVKHTCSSEVYGEPICRFLTKHIGGEKGENHTGSGSKRLPVFAFNAPEEFRRGILCGLVDTDGTCSVSTAKDKPQLMINFYSNSLRLCRDMRFLCRTLGISTGLSFSKNTENGNVSWCVTLSTVDCRRLDVFSRLESPWKRRAFLDTYVDADSPAARGTDMVPLPASIARILRKLIGCPKISVEDRRRPVTVDLEDRMLRQKYCQMTRNAAKSNLISRASAREIIKYIRNTFRDKYMLRTLVTERLGTEMDRDGILAVKRAISDAAPFGSALYKEGQRVCKRLDRPLSTGRITETAVSGLMAWFKDRPVYVDDLEALLPWKAWVDNEEIRWSKIEAVEKTGRCEDGYDLTVPGYETFMSADGVVLSNTLNLHLPSGREAVQEAYEKLMPSKMLFSIRDQEKVIPVPKHEQVW